MEKIKVIFLDVDGVLNSDRTVRKTQGGYTFVDNRQMKNLKHIINMTGAKVVLSSDWRYDRAGTLVQNTETYLGLAENPLVDVIGHCAATKFVFDYETGIKAFKEHDKLVEINESTLLWKNAEGNYRKIIPLCKKYGVNVIVNTDAHFYASVGQVSQSMKLLEEYDYPEELIVNLSGERILERLRRKNKEIFR